MRPAAIIFDFDGVLLESEYEGNRHLASLLTQLGHPTSLDHALTHFTGLSGDNFYGALERHVGGALPDAFYDARRAEDERALRDGIASVAGAVDFVRALPADLPRAIASSSTKSWIETHLRHLGIDDAFGGHFYSGHEDVAHGKPAPDIYLYAARQLKVPIADCVIIEDSEVGATGALKTGARVIGLAAGRHCNDGHDQRLRSLGVEEIAFSFGEIRERLGLA